MNIMRRRLQLAVLVTLAFFAYIPLGFAATLSLSPPTGVYSSGQTFSASVVINTQGQSINAAEGTLSFNPRELSVVSVSKGSLFNLWTSEPSFSNTAGTVSFSGGNPAGYQGSAGVVVTVTFRVVGAGTARAAFTNGAVLANDGRGTNILSSMNAGTYTLSAQTTTPPAEVVREYVPQANTPGAPQVTSSTHGDESAWHTGKTAELAWTLPAGVTGVRTLLDRSPSSVPTRVYEDPISRLTIEDLDEGVSYFHIQFRNSDGWGRVTHYRLAVDGEPPAGFALSLPEDADVSQPTQTIAYTTRDDGGSPVRRFMVQINGGEAFEFVDADDTGRIALPSLPPGYHTIIVEAFDEAGNSVLGSISLTVASFEKPVFTEYPDSIGTNVIPVIRGLTRPQSTVEVTFTQIGLGVSSADATRVYEVTSDAEGNFSVIPDGRLAVGVYELTAVAIDQYGAQSEVSDSVRIVVAEPGYVRVGTFAIGVLSVIVPLLALTGILVLLVWFIFLRLRGMRRGVVRESREAQSILVREFGELRALLDAKRALIANSRKSGKLTKSEQDLVDDLSAAMVDAEQRVAKEIEDVTEIVT